MKKQIILLICMGLINGLLSDELIPSTSVDSKVEKIVSPVALIAQNEVKLAPESSDKVLVKEKSSSSGSDEKLGTSATIPIGYATANGIVYDAPLTSGGYAAFGSQPAGFVDPNPGYHVAGHGGHNPHGLSPNYPQSQLLGHEGHLGHNQGGYGGVVYGGYGHGAVPVGGSEEIRINKMTNIGVGPYGEVVSGKTIQKSVNLMTPYSPYGHGGVVYMGNGLISEHEAGVQVAGPVLAPIGYQQKKVISKEIQSPVLYNGFGHGAQFAHGHGGHALSPYQNFGHGGNVIQQFQGAPFGHPHQLGQLQHEQIGISKQTGVDPYGNIQKQVRKEVVSTQGHGLGHTDQPYVHQHGPQFHGQGPAYYNGQVFSNPDPYYNNKIDPIYRKTPNSGSLYTTGPNRYYQGKNPIGVYERYHRLG